MRDGPLAFLDQGLLLLSERRDGGGGLFVHANDGGGRQGADLGTPGECWT